MWSVWCPAARRLLAIHLKKNILFTIAFVKRFHQIFDVVDRGKVNSKKLEEFALVDWKNLVCEYFHQVAEVVAGVEAQPLDVVHTGCRSSVANRSNLESAWIWWKEKKILEAELEVELPCREVGRGVAIIVHERQSSAATGIGSRLLTKIKFSFKKLQKNRSN